MDCIHFHHVEGVAFFFFLKSPHVFGGLTMCFPAKYAKYLQSLTYLEHFTALMRQCYMENTHTQWSNVASSVLPVFTVLRSTRSAAMITAAYLAASPSGYR